ncbi:hypothetical protein AADZ90_002255 [Aestuariibius sp. 2305UL40-4]|uniref:hypothetical protein n=1 Tax=Aestuariibius violaceus TaxID=3234132 RepID=UPI00345EF339
MILVLAGVAYFFQKALAATGGTFFYTLDDPYIHLSLAENIRAGHYGINVGEVASPSSSILYPFLLAGLMFLGAGSWGPLILNLIGAAGLAWVFAGLLFDAFADEGGQLTRPDPIVLLPFSFLAIHAFGLPLNGMEHTLHVWVSLAIVAGLLALDRRDGVPLALVVAIIAAPLLRFEGAALAFAAIAVLTWQRRFSAAATAAVVVIVCIASYVVSMWALGLPPLPSSVLTKHETAAAILGDGSVSPLLPLFLQLFVDLQEPQPTHLLIAICLLVLAITRTKKHSKTERGTTFAISIAAAAHFLFGDYGWRGRYEIYIFASLISILFILYRDFFKQNTRFPILKTTATCLIILTVGFSNIIYLFQTPAASHNIFNQQYQMHRFSTEFYDRPVAANDIGYLSYQNDVYLLDLWGLGSEQARQMRADGDMTSEEIGQITIKNGIAYAMVYEEWFSGSLPESWCRLAILETSRVSVAIGSVVFYLIDMTEEQAFRTALTEFEPTLPAAANLTIYPSCDS